jgi:lipopolysaccharide transport system permease protein
MHDTYIRPERGWVSLNLDELWSYRHMIYYLTLRNITAKYKQSVLGVFWVVINPLVSMVAYTFIFDVVANIPSGDVPYPIFNYTGLLPWVLCASVLGGATSSVTTNSNLISKVYFPRLVLPLVNSLGSLVDFCLSFLMLFILMALFGFAPSINMIFIPVFLLIAWMTGLGVGLWFAPLDVRTRDTSHIVGYLGRFWLYATPVVYPREVLPEPFQTLVAFNPMTGVVEGFRWAVLGMDSPPDITLLFSGLIGFILLITGAMFFRRMERIYADIV